MIDRMIDADWDVKIHQDGQYLLVEAENSVGSPMAMNIPVKLARALCAALADHLSVTLRRSLLDAVWNEGNPWTWSTEGLDDGCFFCGRDVPRGLNTPTGVDATEVGMHEPDCPWLLAANEVVS